MELKSIMWYNRYRFAKQIDAPTEGRIRCMKCSQYLRSKDCISPREIWYNRYRFAKQIDAPEQSEGCLCERREAQNCREATNIAAKQIWHNRYRFAKQIDAPTEGRIRCILKFIMIRCRRIHICHLLIQRYL